MAPIVELTGADQVIIRLSDFPQRMRAEMRPALLAGGNVIAGDMRQRLAGKSERIPGALYVKASFAVGSRQGVTIGVDHNRAPHAFVQAKTSTFRHPVYGHDRWVNQEPINYWSPAIRAKAKDARRELESAITKAAHR
jgi:hypothetical protein